MREDSLFQSEAMYPDEHIRTYEYSDYENLDEGTCLTVEDARNAFNSTLEVAYYSIDDVRNVYPNIESFRLHLADQIETVAKTRLDRLSHKKIFSLQIAEELIASAMHPSRIQKQLNNFNDIEKFFESMGCKILKF
ncbi:unnamed protein product [Phytophthora fragariaefolia]|uniref:Unnamed protein product n=1 Tax=Phytophthora fragariaefolia TaxID=1490495 RepID=A0A9W6YFM3_9STRA|nr:unnamed protein product [Phytophthora fragariaefolia]